MVTRDKTIQTGKILVTCIVTIPGLGAHTGSGEEWADNENAMTGAEVTVASALNTAVLPATLAAQPDSAGFIETWKQQRVALVARIAEAVIAEKEPYGDS
jgi:hypothetical protein